jgi:hypothetical protein
VRPETSLYYWLHRIRWSAYSSWNDLESDTEACLFRPGTAIIEKDSARCFTDGRYFLQAGQQLDSNWTLMRHGEKGKGCFRELKGFRLYSQQCRRAHLARLPRRRASELHYKLTHADRDAAQLENTRIGVDPALMTASSCLTSQLIAGHCTDSQSPRRCERHFRVVALFFVSGTYRTELGGCSLGRSAITA